ncbi:L-threonylcarbamoyladenylate synthase [Heliophilum fasciatum]|uniref:Threonylcarbamoyl-AMP synthase n=1 Tax=Heliophilum fasciatum TaxID=35700 RepID=A0A4R2RR07_9FIRM|nr:L-threonylcarbamoyladenylate synthase [Heliophilum fasciatum]MCW2277490.1 L-threonylcarbamoyladenylate synthase [Heliophilum fasciatum]TCP65219.1 translation factor SUA5 [Heliophilum fasciatum]
MKDTRQWQVDPQQATTEAVAEAVVPAAAILRQGGLVAFPTETVYGVGANALDAQAVQAIFAAKGRPADNPLIVHIADWAALTPLITGLPPLAKRLAECFWPGPLTLILPASPLVPAEVTAGLPTVAVRWPAHPVAEALIRAAGVPVAAPSANRSGKPSPTDAVHVLEDLGGRIDGIVDGGPCAVGVESTVLDVTVDPPAILRPGGITADMLRPLLPGGRLQGEGVSEQERAGEPVGDPVGEAPRAPGMKYTHYAPSADVFLLPGPWEAQVALLRRTIAAPPAGGTLGLLISEETLRELGDLLVRPESAEGVLYRSGHLIVGIVGRRGQLTTVAKKLFRALRAFDHTDAAMIVAETYPAEGIGAALMNRLCKSAGGRVWPAGNPAYNVRR